MKSKTSNIGIVGLGGHGRTLQRWIKNTDGLNVASVFDLSDDEKKRSAEMFDCYSADSYQDLIDRGGIEAVVIATPNHLHPQQVTEAIDAGLHVLVEKPISNMVADGLAMTLHAEKHGRLLMIGHNMRFNRASRKAKELLDSGDVGDVVSVEIHFSANNTPYYAPDAWRLQPEYCPLLPVTQLGVHGIDLVHYFIGRISDVYATARSLTVKPPVVDSVSAVMTTDNGVGVTLTSNYCSPVLFEVRIATTKRNIIYLPHRVQVTPEKGMQGDASEWTTYDYSDNLEDGYQAEMELFAHALSTGSMDVEASARGGLQALAVDEALRDSIARKEKVTVADYSRSEVVANGR